MAARQLSACDWGGGLQRNRDFKTRKNKYVMCNLNLDVKQVYFCISTKLNSVSLLSVSLLSIYWVNKCNILFYSFTHIFTKDFQRTGQHLYLCSSIKNKNKNWVVFQNCSKSSKGGRRIVYEYNIIGISPELVQEIPCVIVLGKKNQL